MNKNVLTCKYAKYCGGCNLQGFSYPKQLTMKQEYIEKLLSKLHKANRIIGMDNPLHYRNKIQVSFGYDDRHNIIYGNFVPSTHILVPFDDCMIADQNAINIIDTIKSLASKYRISLFDEDELKGCLRHVQVRSSSYDEYMVIFVVGTNNNKKLELIIKDLLKKHKEIKTTIVNINRRHTSMILGEKNIIATGKGYIEDELCNRKFRLSPSSFYQVNKRQTDVLYNTAINLANFNKNDIVIDAYCGIGTISLIVADKVKEVIGVELNKQAIKDAIVNKKINHIQNVNFVADDAGHFMEKLSKRNEKIDVVIMDPPRSGASDKFLSALVKLKPMKILYISCGPESLRNNLKFLLKKGYVINNIQPVDMFPYTNHIECVVDLNIKR